MKPFLIIVVVVAAAAGVWWHTRPAPPPPPPPVVAEPVRRLAPPGVYFLVQRASVTTDAGVFGFPEGTRVKLVSEDGEKMRVTDGTTEFDVQRKQVTNDLEVAETAARRDAASFRRFEAWERQQKLDVAKIRQQEAENVERSERAKRQRALPPMGSTPNPLDRPAYDRK